MVPWKGTEIKQYAVDTHTLVERERDRRRGRKNTVKVIKQLLFKHSIFICTICLIFTMWRNTQVLPLHMRHITDTESQKTADLLLVPALSSPVRLSF